MLKVKNADIISYKLTPLVSLSQGNVKKSKKMMKIANIEQRNSSYLLNGWGNFNEIFRKVVTYDNIKSYKNPGFHPLDDTFFEKPLGGSN